MNTAKIDRIEFYPCSGFGTQGRSAALYAGGVEVAVGYGATDDEAVYSALLNAGLSDGQAFDSVGAVLRQSIIVRTAPEFPNGEFPA